MITDRSGQSKRSALPIAAPWVASSSDLSRQATLAFPTPPKDVLKSILADAFADRLRYQELQKTLKLTKSNTLGETLANALEFEAVKKSLSRRPIRIR